MAQLLDTMRTQHQRLERLLDEISSCVEAGDASTAQASFEKFTGELLAHLALEDDEFYPELLRLSKAAGNAHLAIVAGSFASNMERITTNLRQLSERHSRGFEFGAFATAWPHLVQVLKTRIHAEETSLYPMYARAIGEPVRRRLSGPGSAG
jgi:hypothetical protein